MVATVPTRAIRAAVVNRHKLPGKESDFGLGRQRKEPQNPRVTMETLTVTCFVTRFALGFIKLDLI